MADKRTEGYRESIREQAEALAERAHSERIREQILDERTDAEVFAGTSQTTEPDDCAFPDEGNYGLTKREWFAGQALAGLACNWNETPEVVVAYAVLMANTLIAALNEEPEK